MAQMVSYYFKGDNTPAAKTTQVTEETIGKEREALLGGAPTVEIGEFMRAS
jgi:hypothetical protein